MAESNALTKGLTSLGDWWLSFYDANKAHIFTGIGIGGTVVTGVLAAQSGARSARKIDRRESELGRRLSIGEKMQLCWTDAIPPIIVGGVACYSEWKSDRLFTTELAKRTTMLIASEKAYETLSRKTKEVLGEKKAKQIQDEVAKEKVDNAIQNGEFSMDDYDRAPRVGNGKLYRYVDGYTMLPFWSTKDYIVLQVTEMREMMSELKARDKDHDYYDKEIGIYYKEWFHRIGYRDPKITSTEERKHLGWNKGYAPDGSQDDVIDVVFTTTQYDPGVAVTVVNWATDPSDMRLGRSKKSSDLA